jgi:hypothetical protein
MERMKYGYARTSTDDQTTALQIAALKRARCSHSRQYLAHLLNMCRATLYWTLNPRRRKNGDTLDA